MALPINIEDLLNKQHVESNRIEFKKGWNPTSIYRSICAFANDFDNIGGGYILVGVEEENGIAKRPVCGVKEEQLDKIQRDIVAYNNLIEPYYSPRLSVEVIDNVHILVIWVPSGANRPYSVPSDVTAKLKKPTFYLRYGTSSIEAKREYLDELREMANKVPFDDRGNTEIKLTDISTLLLREYLAQINSRLLNDDIVSNLQQILEQMDLYDGPTEHRMLKNVAAMMFSEHPEKFFPITQVDIVTFPQGRLKNPNKINEHSAIKGSIPHMIHATLDYLKTNIIKERIIKPKDDARSIRFYNYPYQALEEAVVNALYHRDYTVREPVEITIEPHEISILSYAGPDRSIPIEAIREGRLLQSRRYRNRRLGEFLKELGLSEGRATGIPTIQDELTKNGSPMASIETDIDRSFFIVHIPCHPNFIEEVIVPNSEIQLTDLTNRQKQIIELMQQNSKITHQQLSEKLKVSLQSIYYDIRQLRQSNIITRMGSRKDGTWRVL